MPPDLIFDSYFEGKFIVTGILTFALNGIMSYCKENMCEKSAINANATESLLPPVSV
jgi:hypothetical protein